MNYTPSIAILHLIRMVIDGDRESVDTFCRKYVRRVLQVEQADTEQYRLALQLRPRLPRGTILREEDPR